VSPKGLVIVGAEQSAGKMLAARNLASLAQFKSPANYVLAALVARAVKLNASASN
jgi:hypothetical protein